MRSPVRLRLRLPSRPRPRRRRRLLVDLGRIVPARGRDATRREQRQQRDDYGETDELCQRNSCEHILDPAAWCTRAIYSVALRCSQFDYSVCFNLELKVDQKPRWTIHEYERGEEQEWVDQKSLKGLETRNADIQKELMGWFKLNAGLRSINFRVFTGEPWY